MEEKEEGKRPSSSSCSCSLPSSLSVDRLMRSSSRLSLLSTWDWGKGMRLMLTVGMLGIIVWQDVRSCVAQFLDPGLLFKHRRYSIIQ